MKQMNSTVLLPLYLLIAWVVVVIIGTLYPMIGWQTSRALIFDVLPWPRYFSWNDIAINILAYVPIGIFGFLLHIGLIRYWTLFNISFRNHAFIKNTTSQYILAGLTSLAFGSGLSYILEQLQHWLPSRYPSRLDWLCNSCGTLVGCFLAYKTGVAVMKMLESWHQQIAARTPYANSTLALLIVWLIPSLSPNGLFFGLGDIRWMLLSLSRDATTWLIEDYILQIVLVATTTAYLGIILRTIFQKRAVLALLVMLGLAGLLKYGEIALSIMPNNQANEAWWIGFMVGALIWWRTSLTPFKVQITWAIKLILFSVLVTNISFRGLYTQSPLWIKNLEGLCRLIAVLWPIFACWLMWRIRLAPVRNP